MAVLVVLMVMDTVVMVAVAVVGIGVVVVVEEVVAVVVEAVVAVVDLLMDAVTSVLSVVVIGGLAGIDVDILVTMNVNMFAEVMTGVTFATSTSLEAFSCWAAFDCRSMAPLNRDRVLQAWMPSYHV